MPRPRDPHRLAQLIDTATNVFIRTGGLVAAISGAAPHAGGPSRPV